MERSRELGDSEDGAFRLTGPSFASLRFLSGRRFRKNDLYGETQTLVRPPCISFAFRRCLVRHCPLSDEKRFHPCCASYVRGRGGGLVDQECYRTAALQCVNRKLKDFNKMS